MENLSFKVTGMSCAHCTAAVLRGVNALNGVQSSEVSLESGILNVQIDESAITKKEIIDAVEDVGYDITSI